MKLSAIALAIAGLALGPASASAAIVAESYSFDVIGLTTSSGTARPLDCRLRRAARPPGGGRHPMRR
jgi:hypothetical protein